MNTKLKMVVLILSLVGVSYLPDIFQYLKEKNVTNNGELVDLMPVKESGFEVEKIEVQVGPMNGDDLLSSSFLVDAHREGELHFCIDTKIPQQLASVVSERFRELRGKDVEHFARRSVSRWLSFLRYHKTWTREKIALRFHHSRADCALWNGRKITIVSDVGPVRIVRNGEKCHRRRVGELEGDFFAPPDDRVCAASYDSKTQTVMISAGGREGDFFALSHVIGHALGIGNSFDEKDQKLKGLIGADSSIMSMSPVSFKESDVLAIQSAWTVLTGGLPCLNSTQETHTTKTFFDSIECAKTKVVIATVSSDGSQSCPRGQKYWLSPFQICIQVDGDAKVDCPQSKPAYDSNSGVCCPSGQRFDPAELTCSSSELFQRRTSYLKNSVQSL